jgi:hypothetical protein
MLRLSIVALLLLSSAALAAPAAPATPANPDGVDVAAVVEQIEGEPGAPAAATVERALDAAADEDDAMPESPGEVAEAEVGYFGDFNLLLISLWVLVLGVPVVATVLLFLVGKGE